MSALAANGGQLYNRVRLRGGPDWGLRWRQCACERSAPNPLNLIRLVPA
jgi:hypothetical protein